MRRVAAVLGVVAAMAVVLFLLHPADAFARAQTTMTFGFLLLAAYLVGDILSWARLPRITGYILAGIAFGPQVANLLTGSIVAELKLIDDLALTFIALAAGGELRLADLRERRRSIGLTVVFLTSIVFLGVGAFTIVARSLMPFLSGQPFVHVIVVAALLGTFAVARSPSSAIAIISECKARGPFTEMVLGVTVIMDVFVIVLFAAVVSVCQAVLSGGGVDVLFLAVVVGEIAVSIGAGVLLGWIVSLYITRVRAERALFILAVAFLVTFCSRGFSGFLDDHFDVNFHLEPMLICLTAGFWIQNFGRGGDVLMERIDRSSLPVYVIFFSLTGAALNVRALESTWMLTLLIVGVRAGLIWVGGWIGGRLSGDPPVFRRMSGLSFVTQAGVSLGLAGIVRARFPEWGDALATTIVAVIAINQLVGPALFKLSLGRVGESRRS